MISDASVLIHISTIGRFRLLQELFKEIVIPEGIYTEVVIEGWGLSGSLETSQAIKRGFMKVKQVMDKGRAKGISQEYKITVSNAEVIQLAKEMDAQVVLANEEEVRDAATVAGFKVRGCLGILLEAVKRGIILPGRAAEDVDNLTKSGYRVSEEIIRAIKDALSEGR